MASHAGPFVEAQSSASAIAESLKQVINLTVISWAKTPAGPAEIRRSFRRRFVVHTLAFGEVAGVAELALFVAFDAVN